jgi:hypothetical protein
MSKSLAKARYRQRCCDEALDRLARGQEVTLTTPVLKLILLQTSGRILSRGNLYKLDKENLGAGVYIVRLGKMT